MLKMGKNIASNVLYIYSTVFTERLTYILEVIFTTILNVEYKLTSDEQLFANYEGPRICYNQTKIQNTFHINPTSILFEYEIIDQSLNIVNISVWENLKVFFKTNSEDIPFDLFAASFFMVSRYEEYLKIKKDKLGRFSASSSLAYKYGFIKEPIVNLWSIKLAELLKKQFPDFEYTLNKFRHQPTIDIDNAWAYKNRGARSIPILLKSLFTFKISEFIVKTKVILGQTKDPYDNYDLLNILHAKSILKPIYFFLVAKRSKFDTNISVKNKSFIELIKRISFQHKVGLHPSYVSNSKTINLLKERKTLENILEQEVCFSRQHYLKIRFPSTYRGLIKAGIKEDYSMGFASKIGFRAGICEPFYFFDVELNVKTDLKVIPFQVMDVTLCSYLGLRPSIAIMEIQKLKDIVAEVGGLFVTLWHNESLSNKGRWRGWTKVYESVFK